MKKLQIWWYFHIKNPVVRKGEKGGFKWVFRRFTLDISTVSGNFTARFTADEHPYAYLMAGATDDNILGFCHMMYLIGKTLTTDQGLVNDIEKALKKYEKRLDAQAKSAVVEDDVEERVALETEKAIQEHIEMSDKERKKAEKEIDKRFKKAAKEYKKLHSPE